MTTTTPKSLRFESRRAESAALDRLFAQAGRAPALEREEQLELARLHRHGDVAAGQALVVANLRLVVSIVNRLGARMPGHKLDLVQEGTEGLLRALRHFDPERGVAFTTYAGWSIRAHIFRYLLLNWRLVRVGTTREHRQIFFNLAREKQRLENRGERADAPQLARALGTTPELVEELGRHLSQSEASEELALALSADAEAQPDAILEHREIHAALEKLLGEFEAELPARERKVVDLRWRGEEPATLRACGKKLGVSGERVRQLEAGLLRRFTRRARAKLVPALQSA